MFFISFEVRIVNFHSLIAYVDYGYVMAVFKLDLTPLMKRLNLCSWKQKPDVYWFYVVNHNMRSNCCYTVCFTLTIQRSAVGLP